MPLRAIRKRCTSENALTIAIAATTASHELAGLLAFPPARAASSILLAIFKTIQDVQTNRKECFRLAKRCVTLLSDVKAAMDGHWEDAPEALLDNIAKFEKVLQSLHEDLQRDTEGKWHDRLLRKRAIETTLVEYHAMVDDAARSFQIVTLIHIHRAVEDSRDKVSEFKAKPAPRKSSDEWSTISNPAPPYSPTHNKTSIDNKSLGGDGVDISRSSLLSLSTSSFTSRGSTDSDYVLVSEQSGTPAATTTDFTAPQPPVPPTSHAAMSESPTCENEEDLSAEEQAFLAELALFEDRGFQRYEQGSIRTGKHKARLSAGWWHGAREVEVNGRAALMMPYTVPGDSSQARLRTAKRWLRDVKTLQKVYHPNLPELIGYSGTDAPTPFILLANVQTRLPQALLLSMLANASLLDCTKLLISFYRETLDAALYLQCQMSLSDSKTQDYVEHASFRISPYSEKKVVMGLPEPSAGVAEMQSWRNFGLAWSIRNVWLAVLPKRGRVDRLVDLYDASEPSAQMKTNHFVLLARTLLPENDAPTDALARLDALAHVIAPPTLPISESDDVDDLLDLYDSDEDSDAHLGDSAQVLTLRRLREVALNAGSHSMTWSNNFVPPHLFRVGDIGYIRPASNKKADAEEDPSALWSYGEFDRFSRVCNIFEEAVSLSGDPELRVENGLDVRQDHSGWTTTFDHGSFEKTEIQPFEAGGDILGWPIVTSPGNRLTVHMLHCNYTVNVNDAWKLLAARAPELARARGVHPEDLMLVTRSGTEYRIRVHDIRTAPPNFGAPTRPAFPPHHTPFASRPAFPGHGFPGHHQHMQGPPPPPPLPSYVFTSESRDFALRLQDTPVCFPHAVPAPQQARARCAWASDGKYGFVNYVRLCAEDFA